MRGIQLPAVQEIQAHELRKQIVAIAAAGDLDTVVVVAALADALATVAVLMDRETGERSLQDRLHSFYVRVEDTYRRTHDLAETK